MQLLKVGIFVDLCRTEYWATAGSTQAHSQAGGFRACLSKEWGQISSSNQQNRCITGVWHAREEEFSHLTFCTQANHHMSWIQILNLLILELPQWNRPFSSTFDLIFQRGEMGVLLVLSSTGPYKSSLWVLFQRGPSKRAPSDPIFADSRFTNRISFVWRRLFNQRHPDRRNWSFRRANMKV